MNKEKLYMDIDYFFAWNDYEFHMKDGSVFVAYCEQDGGIGWRLKYFVGASKRRGRPVCNTSIKNMGHNSISIENEYVEYVLDLEEPELFF